MNLVQVSVKSKWTWQDSDMEKKKMKGKEATLDVEDGGKVLVYVPVQSLAPDYGKYGMKGNRLVLMKYVPKAWRSSVCSPV